MSSYTCDFVNIIGNHKFTDHYGITVGVVERDGHTFTDVLLLKGAYPHRPVLILATGVPDYNIHVMKRREDMSFGEYPPPFYDASFGTAVADISMLLQDGLRFREMLALFERRT